MANLKAIRDRISSVKNTRKITEAMRLVAAAKVRRAQEQVLRTRPFADRLARVLQNLESRMGFEGADSPLLGERRDVGTITLLVVTGDRGLCGGYNANVIRRAEQRFAELKGQGFTVDMVLMGRKAITYFTNRSYPIRATFTGLEQVPTSAEAGQIANEVLAAFLSASTDRVEIVFTRFINLVSSQPVVQTLLPLDPQGIASPDDEIFRLITRDGRLGVEIGKVENAAAGAAARLRVRAEPGAAAQCPAAPLSGQPDAALPPGSRRQRAGQPDDGDEQRQRQRQGARQEPHPRLQQGSPGGHHPGDPGSGGRRGGHGLRLRRLAFLRQQHRPGLSGRCCSLQVTEGHRGEPCAFAGCGCSRRRPRHPARERGRGLRGW